MTDYYALPGGELVDRGLVDLQAGTPSVEALLVAIASQRLRRVGVHVPEHGIEDAELRLYAALAHEIPAEAYSRYNSLLRRLDSFASALEREQGKAIREAD